MIGFLLTVALVGVVALVVRRRKRQRVLSGLVASKPQFTSEPPLRRHGSRRTELL